GVVGGGEGGVGGAVDVGGEGVGVGVEDEGVVGGVVGGEGEGRVGGEVKELKGEGGRVGEEVEGMVEELGVGSVLMGMGGVGVQADAGKVGEVRGGRSGVEAMGEHE
uniref:hypothetical protein n=1 Tax=Kocuria rhizophila TaxID=72000 RepID=UPI001C92F570